MTLTQDEQAIHAIVESMEAAWNRGDGERIAARMAGDADFIDVLGRHHVGREVIAAGHDQIFSTIYKGSTNRFTVEKIRFLADNVAVCFVRTRLTTTLAVAADDPDREAAAPGAPREEGARPMLVFVKHGSHWIIEAFQNTRIA
jgi:uncharacterized protein (TIGR02246 family)